MKVRVEVLRTAIISYDVDVPDGLNEEELNEWFEDNASDEGFGYSLCAQCGGWGKDIHCELADMADKVVVYDKDYNLIYEEEYD